MKDDVNYICVGNQLFFFKPCCQPCESADIPNAC